MHQYQSRYEQAHNAKKKIGWLLIIGVFLCAAVYGGKAFTEYFEEQQLIVTQDFFSEKELDSFQEIYGFALDSALEPAYEFRQGINDEGIKYKGIVLNVASDISSVLRNSLGLNPDGEAYLQVFNDCRDYFELDAYHGPLERIQTHDGRKKAIMFHVDGMKYQFFFYEGDNGKLQLMARQ